MAKTINDNSIKLNLNNPSVKYIHGSQNQTLRVADFPNFQKEFGKYTSGNLFLEDIPYLNDRRANAQSGFDKFGNALAKTLITAATTFVDTYALPTVGVATALTEGRLSGLWDNSISNLMNNIRNKSEELLPNYYTNEEMEMPFYEALYEYPANFWFDKFMKNTGFTIGMLTGGASMSALLRRATGISKYRTLGKYADDLAKTALSNADKKSLLFKMYPGLNNAERLSHLASTIRSTNSYINMATMGIAAMAEGATEALSTIDELKAMYPNMSMDELRKAGNFVWALNVPLLWGSNYIQFKNILMKNFKNELPFNKVLANGVLKNITELSKKDLVKGGLSQAKKGLTRQAMKNVLKVAATEGLYEEMGQAAVSKAAKKMYDLYKNDYSLQNILSSLSHGVSETYTSVEGWEEGFLGALTALLPFGGKSSGAMQLLSYPKEARANTQTIIDHLNNSEGFRGKFVELYNNNNFQNNLIEKEESEIQNQYKQYANNELALANDVGVFSALGRTDILKDRYNAIRNLDNINDFIDILGIDKSSITDMKQLYNVIDGIVEKINKYEELSDNVNTVFAGLKNKDIDFKHVIRNVLFNKSISKEYAQKKHSEIIQRIQNANISDINAVSSIIADITLLSEAQSLDEIKNIIEKIDKDTKNNKYKTFKSGILLDYLDTNIGLLTEAIVDKIYYNNVYDSLLTKEGRDEFKSSFEKARFEKILETKKEKLKEYKKKKKSIKAIFEESGRDELNDIIKSFEDMKNLHNDTEYQNKVDEVIKDLKDFRDNIENELKQEAKEEKQKQEAKKVEDFIDNFQIKDNITKKDLEDFDYNTDSDFISDKHKVKKDALKKMMSRIYLSKYINDMFLNNIGNSKDTNEIKNFIEEGKTISDLLKKDIDFVNKNQDLVGKYYTILENLKDDTKEDEEEKDILFTDEEKETLSIIFNLQIKINNENKRIVSLTKNPEERIKKMDALIKNMETRDYMKNATIKFLDAVDEVELILYENSPNNPTQLLNYINIIREKFDKAFPEARKKIRHIPPTPNNKITQEMLDEIEAAYPVNFHTANTYNYNAKKIRDQINNNEKIDHFEGKIHNRLMNLKKGDVLKVKINGHLILKDISETKTVFETLVDKLISKARFDIESVKDFIGNIPFVFVDNNNEEVGMTLQTKKYQDDILKKGENDYFENKYNKIKNKYDNASVTEKKELQDKLDKALGDVEVHNKIKNEYNITMQIRYRLFLKAINENLSDIIANKNYPYKLEDIFSKNTIELEIENTTDVQPFLNEKDNYVSDMVNSKYDIDVGFLEKISEKGYKEKAKSGKFNFLSYQSHKIEERLKRGSKNIFYEKPIDERLLNHYRAGAMVIKLQNGMPMIVFGNFNNLYEQDEKYKDIFEKNIMSNVINLLDFKTISKEYYDKIYDKEAGSAEYNELVKKKIDKIKNFFNVSDFIDILKQDDKKQRQKIESEIETYISKKSLENLLEKSTATINYKGIVNKKQKTRYNIFAIKSSEAEIQKGNKKIYKGQIDVYVQGYKLEDNTNKKVFMQKITLDVNNNYVIDQYKVNDNEDEVRFFEDIQNKLENSNVTIQKKRLNELFKENKNEYTAVVDAIFHSLKAPYKVVKDNKGNVISNLNPEGKRPFTVSVKFKDEARSVQGEDSIETEETSIQEENIEEPEVFEVENASEAVEDSEQIESVPSTEEQTEEPTDNQSEEFSENKMFEDKKLDDHYDDYYNDNIEEDSEYFFKDNVLNKNIDISLMINKKNQELDRQSHIEFDKKINSIYKNLTGKSIKLVTEQRAKEIIGELDSNVRGFWKNGHLFIIKERKNPDVFLHESLHPFIDILEKENSAVYNNILNEAKKNYSEILNKIKEKYDEKSVDKELLVYAIQSEIITLNESSNILKDFLNWLKEFISKGITKIALLFGSTNYQYLSKDTTIKDIAKLKYYTELLSKEYIKEQFLDSSERRLSDKEKALIKPQLVSLYAAEAYNSKNTRLKPTNKLSDVRFVHKLLTYGSNEINIDSLIGKSLIELLANKDFLKEIQSEYNKLFKFKGSDKINIDDLVEDSVRGLDIGDTNKTGIHQRNSANLQIKLFLASLTQSKLNNKNNKNNKIVTVIKDGLPLGIDYNNFFHKLMILGTEGHINSFESFFNALEDRRLKVLEINSMLNQLDEIKKECEKIKDMTHYNDLRNAIYTTFNKTSNNVTLLSVDSSVTARRINNGRSIKHAIANELLSKSVRYLKGIEIGLHDENMSNVISAEMSIDRFDALRKEFSTFLGDYHKTPQLDKKNISKLTNMLNDIIELLDFSDIVTAENFEVILNNNGNKVEKDDIFHSFFEYINDVYGRLTYTHDKRISGEGVQNVLNKKALEFSESLFIYGNKLPDAMTQSAEKKQLYTFGDKSYTDKVINQIHGKDAESRERFLNAILNDKTLKNSYLKNQIFNEDNTVKRNFAEHLDIKLFSGIRHRTSGRNYDFKNMNGYDKIFVDLMFFEPKKYNSMLNTVLIPFSPFFDSGTNNYIELPEIKINYNEIAEWSKTEEKIVKSAIFNPEIIYQPERTVKTEDNKSKIIPEKTSEYFEAVYSSVNVEMERMKLAKSLVDRYNKGEKVVLYNNEHGYFDYNNNFVTHEKGKYIGNAFKFHFLTGLNELIDGKTGIVDESLITKEAVAKELQKLLLANYDYIQSQDYDLYKYVEGHEIIYIMKALINRIVYGQGLTEMFSGHISNYKNLNDYYQRNKFIGTIGINGALDEEVKYITFHDPLYSTALENEYRNQLEKSYKANGFTDENIIKEKINEAIDDYKNMVATDGQIYCTPEFYEKYQKNIGKELSSKGRGAHSLKPLVFLRESKNDTSYAKGIKSSMFAINETMGDKYKILLDFMRNNKIDMVVASSSVKMGLNTQTISLFENGTLNFTDAIGKFQSDKIQSFNMRDLMVQQELPESHIDHSNKTSSQVLPLMVSNIQDDFVYTGANGKQYNGSEIKKIHDKIFSGILNYEKNKIFQELNIKTDENGNIVKYNRDRLFELLENELKENPKSIVNVLKSNSNLSKLPLYGERLKSIIDSYISKRMIYPKLPGSHNIAVSDALDDSLKARYDVISKKTKEVVKKDVNKDEEFDPNTEEMALIIPIKMPRWDSALEDVSIEKIPIDSRRMIGYRIPYSGKSLSFIAEVVGFTPRSSGSTIIIGKDVIARTGFDFDIDTFYFIQRKLKRMVGKKTVETRINKETNKEFKISKRPITIESENSFFNPENKKDVDKMEIEELYNSFIDLYEMILGSSNHAIESITPANYKKSVEISKNINDSLIRTDKYPTHVSIETSTEYIKNVLYQKKLIAIVANTNTMLSKLASYGAYFAKSKWHWMDENETTHQLDKFNTIKSIDGSEMSAVNISTNLNHAVDAVKKLLPVTFNENTASYVLTMMKLGVPYEAAMYIIGQQSVYEYNQFLQRSKISKKNFGIKNIIGTYNNNAKNLLTAFSSKYESLNEFAKDIVKKYGKIEGATDYKGNRDAIIGMYEDDIDSKGSGINETPSRIKYFSQNNKIFNEANIKITNAIKKQEEFKKLIPAKHQPSISSISDMTSKIRELVFNENFNENTTYKVLFDYKDRKLIVSGVEEIKDVTKAKADDIIIKKRKDNYDKTRSYKVFTFYDLRKTEAKTSLDEFLKSKEGKLKENTTEEEFIKDLVAYNKFQVHVLENVINFNKTIGAELKNVIPIFGMEKKKVNESNPQRVKEAFFKSERKGNLLFANKKGIYSNMIGENHTNEISKIKYSSQNVSNALNKFNTIDPQNNISVIAYKLLSDFGYEISSNPRYEKRIKESVFMQHFKNNISSESIFNISNDEKIRLLGFDDYQDIKLTTEYEKEAWATLPLSVQIQSIKKTLNAKKSLKDINKKIIIDDNGQIIEETLNNKVEALTDENFKLYNKTTSLLLNLKVENDSVSKNLKDGLTLITLDLDVKDLDVINLLTDSFEEMLNSDIDIIRDVAVDLVKYLYLTTGFSFSTNQLCSVLDFTKLEQYGISDINNVLNKAGDVENITIGDEILLDSLVAFVLNNPNLFKFISSKQKEIEQKSKESREKNEIKLIDDLERNDEKTEDDINIIKEKKIDLILEHFNSKNIKNFDNVQEKDDIENIKNIEDLDDIELIEDYLHSKLSKGNYDNTGFYSVPLGENTEYNKYLFYIYYKNKLTRVAGKGNSYLYETNINEKSIISDNNGNMTESDIIKGNNEIREYLKEILTKGLTSVIVHSESFDKIFSGGLTNVFRSRFKQIYEGARFGFNDKVDILKNLIDLHLKDYLTFANNIESVSFNESDRLLTFNFKNDRKLILNLTNEEIDSIIIYNANKNRKPSKPIVENENNENEIEENKNEDTIIDELINNEYQDEIRKLKFEDIESRVDILYEIIKRKYDIRDELTMQEKEEKEFQENSSKWTQEQENMYNNVKKELEEFEEKISKFSGIFSIEEIKNERYNITKEKDEYKKNKDNKKTEEYKNKIEDFDKEIKKIRSEEDEINNTRRKYTDLRNKVTKAYNNLSYTLTVAFNIQKEVSKKEKEKNILEEKLKKAEGELNILDKKYSKEKINDVKSYINKLENQIEEINNEIKEIEDSFEKTKEIRKEISTNETNFFEFVNENDLVKKLLKKAETKKAETKEVEPKKEVKPKEDTSYLDNENIDNIVFQGVNNKSDKIQSILKTSNGINAIDFLNAISIGIQEKNGTVYFGNSRKALTDEKFEIISGRVFSRLLISEPILNTTFNILEDFIINNNNDIVVVDNNAKENMLKVFKAYNNFLEANKNKITDKKVNAIDINKISENINLKSNFVVSSKIVNEAQANALKKHNEQKC